MGRESEAIEPTWHWADGEQSSANKMTDINSVIKESGHSYLTWQGIVYIYFLEKKKLKTQILSHLFVSRRSKQVPPHHKNRKITKAVYKQFLCDRELTSGQFRIFQHFFVRQDTDWRPYRNTSYSGR